MTDKPTPETEALMRAYDDERGEVRDRRSIPGAGGWGTGNNLNGVGLYAFIITLAVIVLLSAVKVWVATKVGG